MSTRVDIVGLGEGRATLRVQYGRGKAARIQIMVPEPAYNRTPPAAICRIELHELVDALDEWLQQSDDQVGDLRTR